MIISSGKTLTKRINYLWAISLLLLLLTISACAPVHIVKIGEVNSTLNNLVKDRKEISKVQVLQYAVYLEVRFDLKENLAQQIRQDIFTKTKDYVQQGETKRLFSGKLGKDRIEELYNHLSIRFQNNKTKDYWLYHINLESKEWELLAWSERTKTYQEYRFNPATDGWELVISSTNSSS